MGDGISSNAVAGTGVHPSLEYLDHIRSLPCIGGIEQARVFMVCAAQAEPHHLRRIGAGGNTKKPNVRHYTAVPLCREHHDQTEFLTLDECEKRWRINLWQWAFRNYLRWLDKG